MCIVGCFLFEEEGDFRKYIVEINGIGFWCMVGGNEVRYRRWARFFWVC